MNQFQPRNSSECINLEITDELLSGAKIAAYMYNQEFQNAEGKDKPFAPKAFPGKAIIIVLQVAEDIPVTIYFDSNDYAWDSSFVLDNKFGKLTPDQMAQFFSSKFYANMIDSLAKKWPTSDPEFGKLFDGVKAKKLRVGIIPTYEDELICGCNQSLTEIEHKHEVNQPGKRKDLANKDISGDGKRDYSGSGRRIVTFSDQGVKSSSAEYYCWPRKGKEFKWNSWKDWTKQKPFCKMTFEYNGRKYMISTSLFDEQFDNRGFRGGDCDWEPPFAWLTPGECEQVMHLSIVRKFLRQCKKRVKEFISMSPEEVYAKIDKPERVTVEEITKTQRVIRHVIDTLFNKGQRDNYCYN